MMLQVALAESTARTMQEPAVVGVLEGIAPNQANDEADHPAVPAGREKMEKKHGRNGPAERGYQGVIALFAEAVLKRYRVECGRGGHVLRSPSERATRKVGSLNDPSRLALVPEDACCSCPAEITVTLRAFPGGCA